ncbi:MAG TPA: urea carboxylase-associated family protein [Paracoccaceae bacterium]|nr:urea carboxylase-associated family protein [Paracoccaceae bacterium]
MADRVPETVTVPAGEGRAIKLRAGAALCIVNTHGTQVVDTWAVSLADPAEMLSVEHTRRTTGHLHPERADVFVSNRRTPMLRLEEDSFPGTHDTIVACCDRWLYRHYGAAEGHANCHDNFTGALAGIGIEPRRVPNPVNLWMNVPVEGNAVSIAPPLSRPGDHVLLRALMDLAVVLSACPMDMVPINGPEMIVRDVHATVLPPDS